jgi:5-methylcytosine-specific restriction enzyme B
MAVATWSEITARTLLIGSQILVEHPEGLRPRELWAAIEKHIPDLVEQWELSESSGSTTPVQYFRFSSIELVKAGWLTRNNKRWFLTSLGRHALAKYTSPELFHQAYRTAYGYAQKHKAEFERAERITEAVPEGAWIAGRDLAQQTGLDEEKLLAWLQGERPEGWHRVLDSDGGIPDAAHADEKLRHQWSELLEEDGLRVVLGMVQPERRVLGNDLPQLRHDNGSADVEDRARRAWLVRGSNVQGVSLTADWLADGYCSLPASKLRELPPGASQETIRAAVDEDYAHGSFNDRQKKTSEFYTFLTRMREDDIVLSNDGGRVYIGYVRGGPGFRASVGNRANLQRPVEWINADKPLDFEDDLPDEIAAKLATQHDVLDLTEFLEDLEALVEPRRARASTREFVLPDATEAVARELLVDEDWVQECVELLKDRPQLIFYGPPGTGKTYIAQHLAQHLVGGRPENVKLVQFHPAYSYEDFFEGFRPAQTSDGQGVVFKPLPGPLLRLVDAARQHPEEPHVLIIDEINRGNLAKIFGELYFLLEYRDKAIDLLYSSAEETGQPFTLPKNLLIIGTMNTADRSIALVDAAMRRRFAFIELHPETQPTSQVLRRWLAAKELSDDPARLLEELNARIEDRDFKIGPSYLMRPSIHNDPAGFARVWRTQILPLLEEHHYGDGIDVNQRYGLDVLRYRLGLE